MKRYNAARADFEFLESIAELDDQMSVEEQLLDLMRDPSKKRAALMYESCIELWFKEHGVSDETRKIAERNLIV